MGPRSIGALFGVVISALMVLAMCAPLPAHALYNIVKPAGPPPAGAIQCGVHGGPELSQCGEYVGKPVWFGLGETWVSGTWQAGDWCHSYFFSASVADGAACWVANPRADPDPEPEPEPPSSAASSAMSVADAAEASWLVFTVWATVFAIAGLAAAARG